MKAAWRNGNNGVAGVRGPGKGSGSVEKGKDDKKGSNELVKVDSSLTRVRQTVGTDRRWGDLVFNDIVVTEVTPGVYKFNDAAYNL